MTTLSLFSTLVILFVNLWGGALVVGWFWTNRWLAVGLAPLLWVTVLFGVECHVGLGAVSWMLPITSAASVIALLVSLGWNWKPLVSRLSPESLAVWRAEFAPRNAWGVWAVFVAVFGYALAWRMAFPDIDNSSEKLSDLSYIASYYSGGTIPVLDAWLHPYRSVHYYSYSHYAAALLGRMLGTTPGYAYNLAFCVLVGLTGFSFAAGLVQLSRKFWVRGLLLATFVLGGSGASGVLGFFYKDADPWTGMRFIGCRPYDQEGIGQMAQAYADTFKKQELPGEPFSYSVFLGDYHPPITGYYLLGLGVAAAALWQARRQRRYAWVVGATVTWSVLSNTWSMPLQLAWIAGWWLWTREGKKDLLIHLLVGALAVWLSALVYLNAFVAASAEYNTALRLVPWDAHTPPWLLVLYLAPTLGLILLSFYTGRREALWLGLGGLLYVLVSEFVWIDDAYSGEYERFNTTLKWWPWISAAMVIGAGPLVLEHSRRTWVKVAGILFCLYPCVYAIDLSKHWVKTAKPGWGKLEGQRYIRDDEAARILYARIKKEPRGVVAERPVRDSYTKSAYLPLFAGHRMYVGWQGHESLWRGFTGDILQRYERLLSLYDGTYSADTTWVAGEGIDYLLWYQEADTLEKWPQVHAALNTAYDWVQVYEVHGGRKVGFWRRKGAPHWHE